MKWNKREKEELCNMRIGNLGNPVIPSNILTFSYYRSPRRGRKRKGGRKLISRNNSRKLP